jgi:hypothetical protein
VRCESSTVFHSAESGEHSDQLVEAHFDFVSTPWTCL